MERINPGSNAITKPMNQMDRGEVCRIVGENRYVLHVSHSGTDSIFLILNDHTATNTYRGSCTIPVTPLTLGESVTIKFS
jgi:hypothetical protein